MNRYERTNGNFSDILRAAVQDGVLQAWTALPATVVRFPGSAGGAMTVDVQPTVTDVWKDQNGNNYFKPLPILQDCPLLFQGGGGATMTFPIKAAQDGTGDECLIIIASRCIDSWWQLGGIQNPISLRHHNLSDGFALVGMRSLPKSFAVDTTNVCLISDDQSTYVKMSPSGKTLAMQATNGINLNGVTIDSAGNVNSPATITASTDVVGGGKSLKTHVHTGVTAGTGVTGPPQ